MLSASGPPSPDPLTRDHNGGSTQTRVIQGVPKNGPLVYFDDNFGKYGLILTIFSLLQYEIYDAHQGPFLGTPGRFPLRCSPYMSPAHFYQEVYAAM